MKLILKTEYQKLYDSLFKSPISSATLLGEINKKQPTNYSKTGLTLCALWLT